MQYVLHLCENVNGKIKNFGFVHPQTLKKISPLYIFYALFIIVRVLYINIPVCHCTPSSLWSIIRFTCYSKQALTLVSCTSMSSTFANDQGNLETTRFDLFGLPNCSASGPFGMMREHDLAVDNGETELLSVAWNQDYGCFAVGTSQGFRIYNCEPFKETLRRDLKTGGFKIVEMLFRCNVLALVGGAANSQYPPNKVLIWDDQQNQCIGEFLFRSEVRGVKLRRDRIVVVLEHKIYVYSFRDLGLLNQIETLANPRGLCCLSHYANTSVLACPGLRRGQIRVEHFGLHITKFIQAHDNNVACLTLTMDGLLLATASTKGTLIRIFNTLDGTLLQEVIRTLGCLS